MAASQFLSDPRRNLRQAVIMGVATSITIVVPAVPWLFSSGNTAAVVSGVIALIFAGLISRARPVAGRRGYRLTVSSLESAQ